MRAGAFHESDSVYFRHQKINNYDVWIYKSKIRECIHTVFGSSGNLSKPPVPYNTF